ncbi:energy transducer TonB [Dyadobacter sp. CY312]|uniref:energy transducer TonB n=1 Tax=Dyadobacter sp. CY312 TaxID=2907303 RepID=UPI001F2F60B4|nr:TonB family protein [Dyadobacter sp. CY312]MCE7039796.1 energy transducer TonB [Dyadobacter sp. CY312]
MYKTTKLLFILLCLTALTSHMVHSQTLKNSEENKQSDEKIFLVVAEQEPEFPGGRMAMTKFINRNMRLSKVPSTKNHLGRVFISFIIDTDGSLQDISIKRGLSSEYDHEAIRIVKLMPNWKPGRQSGRVIRMRYTLPIDFRKK